MLHLSTVSVASNRAGRPHTPPICERGPRKERSNQPRLRLPKERVDPTDRRGQVLVHVDAVERLKPIDFEAVGAHVLLRHATSARDSESNQSRDFLGHVLVPAQHQVDSHLVEKLNYLRRVAQVRNSDPPVFSRKMLVQQHDLEAGIVVVIDWRIRPSTRAQRSLPRQEHATLLLTDLTLNELAAVYLPFRQLLDSPTTTPMVRLKRAARGFATPCV